VDEILGNLAQRSALLPEVDNHTASAILCLLYRLLNTENQVRTARTNVRTENITSIALIMNTKGQSDIGIRDLGRVAEDVDGEPADGWKEEFDISTGDKFGKRTASDFEKGTAQVALLYYSLVPLYNSYELFDLP